jgi:aminoglycoside/choline kinase family phosphotransferase
MNEIIERTDQLFRKLGRGPATAIKRLPQSGGDRIYFRIHAGNQSYIATFNELKAENETFFDFTEKFAAQGAPVPKILAISEDRHVYIQEDLGDISLLAALEAEGETERVMELYKKTLTALANLQVRADATLDYTKCITSREFGKQAILNDLLYFKYYFLDTLKLPYDKEKLLSEFEKIGDYLSDSRFKFFMYRDFQARNVMVKNESVHFIDYQGGMKGAMQYDLASVLWQAKANLSDSWKETLLRHYLGEVKKLVSFPIDEADFIGQYNGYVLIRLLQVLGAYGFRGLFERKSHFLTSIPLALRNLKSFMKDNHFIQELKEFNRILEKIVHEAIIGRFETVKADDTTDLKINIKSFSFKKTGYPADATEHGGGFVFDCRGILNPGRIEKYKSMTGRDQEVKDYLEQETRMPEFLMHVFNAIDIAVEDYLQRGFSDLSVNFGCTGGQHRSVYAADALARHLRNKYALPVIIEHIEQNILETKGKLKQKNS